MDDSLSREIVDKAAQITDPQERDRYLNDTCKGNPELLTHVRDQLLETDETIVTDTGVEEATVLTDSTTPSDSTSNTSIQFTKSESERSGDFIGSYRLESILGEGGFGAVWRASQFWPVRREVALKLLKPGMASGEVLVRFDAERQALAIMDHPGIAKVFDAGVSADGRPYFIMELAEGVPLNEYCDQNKHSVEKRLRLFVEVCSAIQHAHQKGVIHRDLKPTNILITEVDGKPQPKVIDFGIAKATDQQLTDQTLNTMVGQFMGTPAFMSPEQASGSPDIDTISDVYSLGVILFELLTGTLPLNPNELKADGMETTLRRIREETAPRPSERLRSLAEGNTSSIGEKRNTSAHTLSRRLRGELDWIVLKALAKERQRRYVSAAALADDVSAFLNRESVSARPPSAVYQVRVFARRNRAIVLGTLAVLLSLSIGIVGMTKLYFRAVESEDSANSEKKKADAERSRATNALQETGIALEEARYQAGLAWLERAEYHRSQSNHLVAAIMAGKATGFRSEAKDNAHHQELVKSDRSQ